MLRRYSHFSWSETTIVGLVTESSRTENFLADLAEGCNLFCLETTIVGSVMKSSRTKNFSEDLTEAHLAGEVVGIFTREILYKLEFFISFLSFVVSFTGEI